MHGASHQNELVARRALKTCLESTCAHPQIVALQSRALHGQAPAFLEGTPLGLLRCIQVQLFLRETCRRRTRNVIPCVCRRPPRHSEAYDSLPRGLPDIKRLLQEEGGLSSLCEELDRARSPQSAAAALGMAKHPSCGLATSPWHPIFRHFGRSSTDPMQYAPRARIRACKDGRLALEIAAPPPVAPVIAADVPEGALVPHELGFEPMYADMKKRYAVKHFGSLMQECGKRAKACFRRRIRARSCAIIARALVGRRH